MYTQLENDIQYLESNKSQLNATQIEQEEIRIAEYLYNILENDHMGFYDILSSAKYYNLNITKYLNNLGVYNTWYGNILHCLVYLVGRLEIPQEGPFYGYNSYISDDFGVKILNKLIEHNVDIYAKNYYNNTPMDCINKDSITKRINNNLFKIKLIDYYNPKFV
jgi:hypothetical protein